MAFSPFAFGLLGEEGREGGDYEDVFVPLVHWRWWKERYVHLSIYLIFSIVLRQ